MILTSLQDYLFTITIDRPEKKNALTQSMYKEMATAIQTAQSQGAKVVLIQGANGCFTSGNDVSDFLYAKEGEGINNSYLFMHALLSCEIPVVARVEGLAIGIGTTLLLHCDFVYTHENTKFAMPFINLGLVPEYASSYILPRIAGNLKANELLLLGENFDANMALSCGIVNSIEDEASLDLKVSAVIDKLRGRPVEAMKASKLLIRNQMQGISQHIDSELKVFAKAMNSEPAKEAFAAFIEKRPINTDIYK